MRDRIPTKVLDNGAVRYAVYDENGAFLRYEYMLPADEPTDPGTPLSKSTIMSDDVEALIWGAAADRTPNDAFGKVSELYQHWWSVLHGQAYSYYEDVKTPITERYQIHRYGTDPPTTYSKEISIDASGNITLVNPKEVYGSLNGASAVISFMQKLTAEAPCYVSTEGGALAEPMLFYIPAGATYSSGNTNATEPYTIVGEYYNESHYVYLNSSAPTGLVASIVTTQLVTAPAGETTYECSTDRNAYPDSGTVDGLTYKYLGVPFENARQGARIETGSYVGTGTYGVSNPNSLTFKNTPKFVLIICATFYGTGFFAYGGTYGDSTNQDNNTHQTYFRVTWTGNTMSWYASEKTATDQLNNSGATYCYYAFY